MARKVGCLPADGFAPLATKRAEPPTHWRDLDVKQSVSRYSDPVLMKH